MAPRVLHAPGALSQAQLVGGGAQHAAALGGRAARHAGGVPRDAVDETRVAVAQRGADAQAARHLQVRRAVHAHGAAVARVVHRAPPALRVRRAFRPR